MSEKKCPPLVWAIVGFVLGAIAVKLLERFCPARCCGGSGECFGEAGSDCCRDESGDPEEGCCSGGAADASADGRADSPAE